MGRAVAIFVFAVMCAVAIGGLFGHEKNTAEAAAAAPETYRLVHAIGNDETEIARGLTESECRSRKKDNAIVAITLGVSGSYSCLPESLFAD